jgi:hypothetical protein
LLHGYANPLKRPDTSESVNLHKCLVLLDSCRIHATRWRGAASAAAGPVIDTGLLRIIADTSTALAEAAPPDNHRDDPGDTV